MQQLSLSISVEVQQQNIEFIPSSEFLIRYDNTPDVIDLNAFIDPACQSDLYPTI